MVRSKSLSSKIVNIIIYAILILVALLCLLPIMNTIAISFSGKAVAMAGEVFLLPKDFTLASYTAILKDGQFFRSFFNSVVRILLGVPINVGLSSLMAHPLSQSEKYFRHRNKYMYFLIFCMLFGAGLIPSYLLINNLHLMDTIWALILPGAVPVYNIIILMNFFKGIPEELDEAARIDGANPWTTMFKIFVPLALPSIATIALFSFVGHWNSFFDGMIYIETTSKIPLQTYIQQLVADVDTSKMSYEEIRKMQEITSRTFNAAKVVVTMIPVLVVYPFLQKYFVGGLVMGSVKG